MDLFRNFIKLWVRWDSPAYRLGSQVLNFTATVLNQGIKTWLVLMRLEKKSGGDGNPEAVTLKPLEFPIWVRPGSGDVSALFNTVIRGEYSHFPLPIKNPGWMIDAGAYIGDTSAFFMSGLRNMKVIALEPDSDNYKMAQKNLEPYGQRVTLLQSALYSEDCLHYFEGKEQWAYLSNQGTQVQCRSIPSLLRENAIDFLDILKMDIEGGEEYLFESSPETWLGRVGVILMEIHSKRGATLISKVLESHGFSIREYRTIWYCINTKQITLRSGVSPSQPFRLVG